MDNGALKGTTIITSISNKKIIIAADSRQTWGGDSVHDNFNIPLKCKIRHIGNFFFAAEGHTTMISPYIDFLEIIESADLSKHKSFIDKIAHIESLLTEPVYQFALNFEKYNAIAFSEILNKSLFSISFSSFENEKPVSLAMFWEIKTHLNGWQVVSSRAGSDMIPRYIIQGQKNAIENYFHKNPLLKSKLFDEIGVIELVNYQINETPDLVGGPIDIAVITPKSYNWIQKKEQCK